jgi:hypothetical protein
VTSYAFLVALNLAARQDDPHDERTGGNIQRFHVKTQRVQDAEGRRGLSRVPYGSISNASNSTRIDLDQAFREFPRLQSRHNRTARREIAESWTPVLGVAVPYAVGNVVLNVLGLLIVACTFVGGAFFQVARSRES